MGEANRHLQLLEVFTENQGKDIMWEHRLQAVARMLKVSREISLPASPNIEERSQKRASRTEIQEAVARVNTEEAAQALQAHRGIIEVVGEIMVDRTAAAGRRDHLTEEDSLSN